MKRYYLIQTIFVIIFFFSDVHAQNEKSALKKPKLVVGLVVENMRPDYIQRYWSKFGEEGFKKLFSQGASCTNFRIFQHNQSYAAGTATLFTGVTSSIHGIIDEVWYDRNKYTEMSCVRDENYFVVGSDSKSGNCSPKNLLSATITDNLKVYTRGQAKVFSVAMNTSPAVFSAGHAANGAYWFDAESGRMVSSSFYISKFPDWVREFNSGNLADVFTHRNWTTLLAEDAYSESLDDDNTTEKGYGDEKGKIFPHYIYPYVKEAKNFNPLKSTPFANTIVKDFAINLIDKEGLGDDDITDFLTVVFSSMDYFHNAFGPVSVEMEDLYLRLDQEIAALLKHLEQKTGKENLLVFLTSNTSANYPVNYLRDEFHLPVDNFSPESSLSLLASFLNITYGEAKWIEFYNNQQVYLDHKLVEKKKINLDEMREKASDFINQFEAVQVSFPANQLEKGNFGDGTYSSIFNSYYRGRSGDFLFVLKEGWQPLFKYQSVNYTDQSHVPLLFYGLNIPHMSISNPFQATDLVPTLSSLLNIPVPDKCSGKVITELTRQ
jgi:predicted AlkP superfamily pyrophosphatase or phosphodiesterase